MGSTERYASRSRSRELSIRRAMHVRERLQRPRHQAVRKVMLASLISPALVHDLRDGTLQDLAAYWRAANHLSVGQISLRANPSNSSHSCIGTGMSHIPLAATLPSRC